MVTHEGLAAAKRRVEALAYGGLGSVELRIAVLQELATVVPMDGAFFPTADPATLLYTSAVRVDMPDGVTPQFLDNEFRTPDVNKFRSLAALPTLIATLDRATKGERSTSPRFRDIMSPLGYGDELRAVFRTTTTVWGFACLHRASGVSFDDQEIAFVEKVTPHIAEGLRRAAMTERALKDASPDAPGILTLAPDHTLVAATPAGERWVEELAATEWPRSRPLPLAVLAVAQALTDVDDTHDVPRLTVKSASGRWLVLHASHLTSDHDTHIAVVIEPASRAQLEPAIAAAYALTSREGQTLTLLLRGLPTKRIAATLRVTSHTANDHIKAIFAKTGVNSRGELLATIFRDHLAPRP